MRLGFDLDGTLADMQAALAREAHRLFPVVDDSSLPRSAASDESPPAEDDSAETGEAPAAARALTARQQRELWAAVRARENFWETLDEIEPGALARLFRLVRDRKWELIFLT